MLNEVLELTPKCCKYLPLQLPQFSTRDRDADSHRTNIVTVASVLAKCGTAVQFTATLKGFDDFVHSDLLVRQLIPVKFGKDVHGSYWVNQSAFGDHVTIHRK